jgi:hypothetical protein
MEFDSNYENYSLEELEDVLEPIDKEAYPERTKKAQAERNKRLAIRTDSNTKSINQKLNGVTGVVYSPNQAALGTFLGGPFASLYFLKTNFEVLGSENSKKKYYSIRRYYYFFYVINFPFFARQFSKYGNPIINLNYN